MKNSNLQRALLTAHLAGLSVFVKSRPGSSKTAQVRQYADSIGMRLINVHIPLVDLLDIKGVISTDNDTAKFLPLAMWPKEADEPVVILLDELPQAVPAIQNAFSQLLIDKVLGDIKLPKGSIVIATGNRREDKAATHNVPAHVVNRVVHIDLDYAADDFVAWGMNGETQDRFVSVQHKDALINGLRPAPINPAILAFVQFRPSLIHTFDSKDTQSPYASPRSYEQLSKLLDAMSALDTHDLRYDLTKGVVGEGVAAEFISYMKLHADLPAPSFILDNLDTFKMPSEPSSLYAICTGVASIVCPENLDKFYKFVSLLQVEFAILTLKNAKAKWPGSTVCQQFIDFCMAHPDLVSIGR